MKKLIYNILYFREVTMLKDDTCFFNLYNLNGECLPIDNHILNELISVGILTFDSGNFETGERHYILNFDFMSNIHDRIKFIINKANLILDINFRTQILQNLNVIERREKMLKIENMI
jgi:hypothetical protein